MGVKFFRIKMYPVEDFEASFQFMQVNDFVLEMLRHAEAMHQNLVLYIYYILYYLIFRLLFLFFIVIVYLTFLS